MRGNTVRKQVFIYAGIALAVAVAVVLWFVFTQRHVSQLFAEGDRVNILCAGRDVNQSPELLMLLSISKSDEILFSIPTNLRLRDASSTFVGVSELFRDQGALATAEAVGAFIGMDIPFYVTMNEGTLRDWIDEMGGVDVTLDANAVYLDPNETPPLRVEVRAGIQRFDGEEAIVLATALSESGDMGLLARQQALLQAVLSASIADSEGGSFRTTVRTLFSLLETNLSLADLTEAAEVLRTIPPENVRANQMAGQIVEIDGVAYTQPSVVETERLVAALLKGLELLTPGDVRAAVFNGNGVRQIASRTADYLRARGFQVTVIGNAESFDYKTSYVIVLTDESKAWVLRDALPGEVQIVFPETFTSHYEALKDLIPAGTDIVLIVGAGLEIE